MILFGVDIEILALSDTVYGLQLTVSTTQIWCEVCYSDILTWVEFFVASNGEIIGESNIELTK